MEAADAVNLKRFGVDMFVVRTSLRLRPIQGLGCFAEESIKIGQVVWQFDPCLDIRIPIAELSNYPVAIQEHFRIYTYVEKDGEQEVMVYCADLSKHMNHSDTPNLFDTPDNHQEIALRDIEIGEELTCDYYSFDLQAADKLNMDTSSPLANR